MTNEAKDIAFYHLTFSPLERVLPALLRKTLSSGECAVVRCASLKVRDALDRILWEVTPFQWLPHGTEKMGFGARQPIWLTTGDDIPNQARFLFRVDGAGSENYAPFSRVFDLFDGHREESVQAARRRWKEQKDAGYALSYWQQNEHIWQRKA